MNSVHLAYVESRSVLLKSLKLQMPVRWRGWMPLLTFRVPRRVNRHCPRVLNNNMAISDVETYTPFITILLASLRLHGINSDQDGW